MRAWRTAVAALVMLAAVSGCGSDQGSEPDASDGEDPPAESDPGDGDPTDESSSEDGGGQDNGDGTGGDDGADPGSGDEAAALMEQASSATFYAVYEVTDSPEGDLHHVVAQDPPRFSWRQSDAEAPAQRSFAQHLIAEAEGTVVSCMWLGDVDDEDVDEWECAREESSGSDLFGVLFGSMLFDAQDFPVDEVATAGWEAAEPSEIAGREATCGSSPAFAAAVTEVCLDEELGLPLAVERDDGTITVVELRAPADDDFAPPAEAWESSDG